jgi:hypothetical protein
MILLFYFAVLLFGRLATVSSFETILRDPKTVTVNQEGVFTNGALVQYQGVSWMAVRKLEGDKSFIYIGAFRNEAVTQMQRLYLRTQYAEDPRLIVWEDQLVVVYNDLVNNSRRMHLAFLEQTQNGFKVSKIQPLAKEGEMKNTEKNWVPFVFEGELFFLYETNPWTVIKYAKEGPCTIVCEQELFIPGETAKLSGGTPAILHGGEFISFFHIRSGTTRSYISWNRYVYFMGAYAFEAKPPFLLKRMTVKPLSYKGAYNLAKNPKKILYPVGLTEDGDDFLVTMGVNDSRTELVKVSKEKLISLMVGL